MTCRRKLRVWVAAAIVFGVVLQTEFAVAQEWSVKRFELANVEPAGSAELPEGFGELQSDIERAIAFLRSLGVNVDSFPSMSEPVEITHNAKVEAERYLGDVAELYESWGFPEPALDPIVETADGGRAYRIYVVNGLGQGLEDTTAGGYYLHRCGEDAGLEKIIVLSADSLLDDGGLVRQAFEILGHELFHAVQRNSAFFECRSSERVGAWIVEGQAKALGHDAQRILRTSIPNLPGGEVWGNRVYSVQLPRAETGEIDAFSYGTSSFWRYLAEMSAGGTPGPEINPVDYRFLAGMNGSSPVQRDCHDRYADCKAEVRWLDGEVRRVFAKPLREIFALFLQSYVQYGRTRVRSSSGSSLLPVGDDDWVQDSFYPGCAEIELDKADPRIEQGEGIDQVAEYFNVFSANCFRVTPKGYDGIVRVQVRAFEGDEGYAVSELIVGTEGRPLIVRKPGLYRSIADNNQLTAYWDIDLLPNEPTLVLVSNIPQNMNTARDEDNMRFNFRVLEEFASMSTADLGDDVEIAGIELDRIQMSYVIPSMTELQQSAGFIQPCALRLSMSSSRTGDTLELHMDHEGPIPTRAYPVVSLERGRYEPPEDHPGRFVVSFGIGKDNITSGGFDQAFGARSGGVVIEEFSPSFIRGRVEAVGERQNSGQYVNGEWVEYPANLATLPLGAVFRLKPELPPRTSSQRSLESCIGEPVEDDDSTDGGGSDSNENETTGESGTSQETEQQTSEEETTDQQTDSPEDEDILASDPQNDTDEPGVVPAEPSHAGASSSDSDLANVDPPCLPLYFSEIEPFADNADLPFSVQKPLGWEHDSDGSTLRGTIHPSAYRDSGIKYDARWAQNDSDLAMAEGIQQAAWPKIGQVTLGENTVDLYGGPLGDAINTYAILPIGDRHLILEVRFLGRRTCGLDPLTALQALFWESIAPN